MKKSGKILIVILCLIIVGLTGFIVWDKVINNKKDNENNNNEKIIEQSKIKSDTSNDSSKELSDTEKQELFNKAIKEQIVLIDGMISTKDFSQKNFTDKEIILLLPDSSEGKIFSPYDYDSGFYSKASISDVEKSAEKLFDKTINVKSAQNNDSIRVVNDDVIVEVRSGVGILNAELVSIDTINTNEYTIKFKFDSNSEIYKLTVNYNSGNVIYKSFEK